MENEAVLQVLNTRCFKKLSIKTPLQSTWKFDLRKKKFYTRKKSLKCLHKAELIPYFVKKIAPYLLKKQGNFFLMNLSPYS